MTSEHAELVRYLNTETMLNLRFTDMKEEKEVINEPTIMGRWRKIKAEGGVGTNSEFAVLHAGKSRRHAVIVKVFNRGPNSRQVSKEFGQDRSIAYIWVEATGINGGTLEGIHVCTTAAAC